MADELCFLGRGAGFYTREGNTSAFFKSGEEMLLIDCGETVFGQLTEEHLLDGVRKLRIIITHLHSDHCGSLGTLGLYWYFSVGHTMELVVPPDKDFQQDLITLMRLYGVPREAFFMTEDAVFGSFAGIQDLRFIPTLHAPDMTCFSLQWISLKGPVFYSADTCEGEPVARFIRDHEDFDRIYMDELAAGHPGANGKNLITVPYGRPE